MNDLVAVPADGSGEPRVLASGRDFYAYPRPSPDGTQVCWTCWDHPNMPWDGTELWVAPLDDPAVRAPQVAGGPGESIWQPAWSPDGRAPLGRPTATAGGTSTARGRAAPLAEQAELGYPQWLLGGSTYDFLPDGSIVCVRVQGAMERLACCAPASRGSRTSGFPTTPWATLREGARRAGGAAWPAGPTEDEAVVRPGARPRARAWCGTPASSRSSPGWAAGAAHARVRERGRAHLARALVAAGQPRLRGARRASCRR